MVRPGSEAAARRASDCTTIGTGSGTRATATWATRESTRWTWPAGSWGRAKLSPRVFSVGGRLGYVDDGETPNTQIIYHDYPGGAPLIFEVRGLPSKTDAKQMDKYKGADIGIVIECEGG